MSGSNGAPPERLTPEAAFAVLGNETRVAILQALLEKGYGWTSFSALRETVGVRDSGQFNYHLGKLVGTFVEHDPDEGYRLRHAGFRVGGAILSGTYTERGEADPIAVDGDCDACGGPLEATYEAERFTVACRDCGDRHATAGVPPGVFADYDPADYPTVFDAWISSLLSTLRSGVCPNCSGRIDRRLVVDGDGDPRPGPADAEPVRVEYDCVRCPELTTIAPATLALEHPAVVSFLHAHGVHATDHLSWDRPWTAETDVVSDDPARVEVTVSLDDDAVTVALDEDATVVATD